jgi:hypothetical protein
MLGGPLRVKTSRANGTEARFRGGPEGGDAMSEENGAAAVASLGAPSRIRRFFAVKAVFTGEFNGARGALLIILDAESGRLDRVMVIIASDSSEFRFPVQQDWKTYEGALISAKLQGQIVHQMSMDVQIYLKKAMMDEAGFALFDALKAGVLSDARKILADIVSKAIADAEVLIELASEIFESVEPPADDATTEAPPAGADQAGEAPAAAAHAEMKLRVEPILAPISGIAAKDVHPGMNIFVDIRDSNAIKQNVARLLTTKAGGPEKGAISAKVLEVAPTEFDRVSITCQLAPNVLGVCNLSGALQIKASGTAEGRPGLFAAGPASAAPEISPNVFLFAAIAVFTFMLVLAYLVFGGII